MFLGTAIWAAYNALTKNAFYVITFRATLWVMASASKTK